MKAVVRGLLLAMWVGCGEAPPRDVAFPVPASSYSLDDVRLVVLESGEHVSLDEARFELRGHLAKTRARSVDPAGSAAPMRDAADPAFYPAPPGYAWFAVDAAARVAVRSLISAESLALAQVVDGLDLALRDFVIYGEEESAGERALRLEATHVRSAAFDSMLERARGSQILFVIPGRVLLAVDVRAPVRGEFWLLGLPEPGESEFVDRMARAALQPR